MSQCDNTVFFFIIRSLFFMVTLGVGFCLVHVMYTVVSNIKLYFNILGMWSKYCKLIKINF